MDFEETKEIFPVLSFLIQNFEERYDQLSLDKKEMRLDEISEYCERHIELTLRVLKAARKLFDRSGEYEKRLKELQCPFNKTGEQYFQYRLEKQRLEMLFVDATSRLDLFHLNEEARKGEAFKLLFSRFQKLAEKVADDFEWQTTKDTAKIMVQLRKQGLPVTKAEVPGVGTMKIKKTDAVKDIPQSRLHDEKLVKALQHAAKVVAAMEKKGFSVTSLNIPGVGQVRVKDLKNALKNRFL